MKRMGVLVFLVTFLLIKVNAINNKDFFYNGTTTFLEVSSQIEVGLYTVEETPKFLGLVKLPIANQTKITGDSKENTNKTIITNSLTLDFKSGNLNATTNTSIDSLAIHFIVKFNKGSGYWRLHQISIDYKAKVIDKSYQAKGQNIEVAPVSGYTASPLDLNCQRDHTTCAPAQLSWSCNGQLFKSVNFGNKTSVGTEAVVTLNFPGLVYQPFFAAGNNDSSSNAFGFNWDCDPLIPSSLWTSLLIGLLLILVFYWAVDMISSVFTPDRFCDPKKPQIQVGQTD